MKKQKVQMFIMLAVLVVAVGAYFGVDKYVAYVENKAAEEDIMSTTYIMQIDADAIKTLSFEYAGESNSFVKEEGEWLSVADKSLEIKQEILNAMADAFANAATEKTLEGVTDLAQYGLAEPSRTFSFTADGVEYVWHVGDMNEVTGLYYMYDAADQSIVYTVSANFLSKFNYGIGGLVVEEVTSE